MTDEAENYVNVENVVGSAICTGKMRTNNRLKRRWLNGRSAYSAECQVEYSTESFDMRSVEMSDVLYRPPLPEHQLLILESVYDEVGDDLTMALLRGEVAAGMPAIYVSGGIFPQCRTRVAEEVSFVGESVVRTCSVPNIAEFTFKDGLLTEWEELPAGVQMFRAFPELDAL